MKPSIYRILDLASWSLAIASAVAISCMSCVVRGAEATAISIMRLDGTGLCKVAQVEGLEKHTMPRWSHDGKRLAFEASGSSGGASKFFIVNVDGSGLREFGEHGSPDWSPDDKQLVYFRLRGPANKGGLWVQNLDGLGNTWLTTGLSPRWSPDGGSIAFTDYKNLKVLDLVTMEETTLNKEPFEDVPFGFTWSPDGKQLAFVGKRNNQRRLYLISSKGERDGLTMRLDRPCIGQLAWSPDGKQLVYGLNDRLFTLEVDAGAEPRMLAGQQHTNRDPAFSPDGQWLAFASTHGVAGKAKNPVREYRLREVMRAKPDHMVYGAALMNDPNTALLGGDALHRGLRLFNLTSGKTKTQTTAGRLLAVSNNRRRAATAGDDVFARVVNLETDSELCTVRHGNIIRAIAMSKDGTRLVTTSRHPKVWEVDTGNRLCTFEQHTAYTTACAFSPDGFEGVSVGQDQTLRVWSVRTAGERLRIDHQAPVWSVAVSPDGRQYLTGTGGSLIDDDQEALNIETGNDNVLRLWDASTGKPLREMKGHQHAVFALAISPDGQLAVSGGWDGTLRLWDLNRGVQLSQADGKSVVLCVEFSSDGRRVIVGGGVSRKAGDEGTPVENERLRVFEVVEMNNNAIVPQ